MKKLGLCLLLLCSMFSIGSPARADARGEIVQLYEKFAGAQNARDLSTVRSLFSDSPDFLWVSDGRPVWGADAAVARMSAFQKSAVWRVVPALDKARAVMLSSDAGFLHLSLVLVIGSADAPDHLPFLVEMIARRGESGWKIEALLTTADKGAQ